MLFLQYVNLRDNVDKNMKVGSFNLIFQSFSKKLKEISIYSS